ncbi:MULTISPECIES: CsiV family protein [unclassified Arsukibacterium]|uniref:CsiV family protein n=1 Tax=unclassified Arsukibacterium TaxID=2635278 RepID=UPI000C985BEA|nr:MULTISPECIES: CsiV family protein [unclassified Arsukibacterium]MAA95912.1 hypothetical protein [Rheinheimera sp.]HAW92775.1 hypothetical protein [Candidatus Azambacteria bacterium]|tara:strand:+ start:175 stop:1326 length:1152 start_codon:yes stop_codon:yes gene_type:complete
MKLSVVKTITVGVTALITVLLWSASNVAIAASNSAERWFEIELIVFNAGRDTELKEQFDREVKPIRLSNSVDLVSAKYQPEIEPLLLALPRCDTTSDTRRRFLPLTLRNWQQWQPPYAPLFCISEPDPAPWQRSSLFPEHIVNTELPMPDNLPVILAGESEQHQSVPYLAPRSAFALTELASKINRQPNQSLLLHTVWRQAPVTEKQAVPSRWFAGVNYSAQIDYWGQDINKTATDDAAAATAQFTNEQHDNLFSAIDTLLDQLQAAGKLENMAGPDQQLPKVSDSLSNLPNHIWQLDGLFKLHLDHYLFINTEFNLRRPVSEGTIQSINVKQSRRVISGELHYLDHPYLGMIIQIRRFEPPEPEPAIEAPDTGMLQPDGGNR